MNDFIGI